MTVRSRVRLPRHPPAVRRIHGIAAAAILVLLLTGFALGDVLPVALVNHLGGHAVMDTLHSGLGMAFAAVGAAAVLLRWRATVGLVRALACFRWTDFGWTWAFARDLLHPGAPPTAFHSDRFDPLQRLVLCVLLAAAAVAAVSGVYLYYLPAAPRWVFLVAIRAHVWLDWVLLVALGLHVFAGLGILPTHRGIARAMFGDGTVAADMAQRLWPAWAERVGHRGEPTRH